jgi:hypothetical protein
LLEEGVAAVADVLVHASALCYVLHPVPEQIAPIPDAFLEEAIGAGGALGAQKQRVAAVNAPALVETVPLGNHLVLMTTDKARNDVAYLARCAVGVQVSVATPASPLSRFIDRDVMANGRTECAQA